MTSPASKSAVADITAAATEALGILGGTFDPIHYGHLRMAEEACHALGLGKVRFIPAGQPPHRDQPGCSAQDRLTMTGLAVAGHATFEVDAAEALADRPSYTVLTLERLRRELGDKYPLVLLLGVDAFLGLATWHRWRELFSLAHIAVAARPGFALDEQAMGTELAAEYNSRLLKPGETLNAAPFGKITCFAMTPLAISATAIRSSLAQGGSPRFLLPDTVLDYIQHHRLYQQTTS